MSLMLLLSRPHHMNLTAGFHRGAYHSIQLIPLIIHKQIPLTVDSLILNSLAIGSRMIPPRITINS